MSLISALEEELDTIVETKLSYYYDHAHDEILPDIAERVYRDFAKWMVNEYRTQDE